VNPEAPAIGCYLSTFGVMIATAGRVIGVEKGLSAWLDPLPSRHFTLVGTAHAEAQATS
jgi:hypothetical protein